MASTAHYPSLISLKHPCDLLDSLAFDGTAYLLQREGIISRALADMIHPFVVPSREAAVNLGFLKPQGTDGNLVTRLQCIPLMDMKDFGWQDCYKLLRGESGKVHHRHCPASDPDLDAAQRLLAERLSRAGLRASFGKGPGSPSDQFDTVSYALWGTRAFASLLREQCVETMASCPREFGAFLGRDFQVYLRHMSLPTTAGDELTLRALGSRFGVSISVATAAKAHWVLRIPPMQVFSKREVYLAWIGNHWAPIRRQSTIMALGEAVLASFRLGT